MSRVLYGLISLLPFVVPMRVLASEPFSWIRPTSQDILESGGSAQIVWTGGSPNSTVNIYLDHMSELNEFSQVAMSLANTGTFDWNLQDCMRVQPFRLYIETTGDPGTRIYSEPFTIQPPVRILPHVVAPGPNPTCVGGRPQSCGSAVLRAGLSTATGPFHVIYLIGSFGGEESFCWDIGGMQCGVSYGSGVSGGEADGLQIDVFSWTLCGDFQFPSAGWPAPGTGNIITWTRINGNCQTWFATNRLVVAGYFYVAAYDADRFIITEHPAANAAKMAACHGAEMLVAPSRLGYATFSNNASISGCNPCMASCNASDHAIPVVRTTWSGIKTLGGQWR
jgi:hypothetical protein